MTCFLTPIHLHHRPNANAPHANNRTRNAPSHLHSYRHRHPAAAARSPRDHCERPKSAPYIRPARAPNVPHMCDRRHQPPSAATNIPSAAIAHTHHHSRICKQSTQRDASQRNEFMSANKLKTKIESSIFKNIIITEKSRRLRKTCENRI